MDPQTMQEVIDLVKTASENLWAAGYARAWAVIATDFMWLGFFAVLMGIFLYMSRYARVRYLDCKKQRERDWHSCDQDTVNNWNVTIYLFYVAAFLALILFAVNLNCVLVHILAPDYLAIEELMNLVK